VKNYLSVFVSVNEFTGALCSDVYQTTTDISPLGVITPDNEVQR